MHKTCKFFKYKYDETRRGEARRGECPRSVIDNLARDLAESESKTDSGTGIGPGIHFANANLNDATRRRFAGISRVATSPGGIICISALCKAALGICEFVKRTLIAVGDRVPMPDDKTVHEIGQSFCQGVPHSFVAVALMNATG